MDAKVGDRISLDAKKVGGSRRTGAVRRLISGLSGVRYEVEWDGGAVSVISPGAGVLLVEGKVSKKSAKSNGGKKPAAKKATVKKPAAKKAATKKAKKKADAKRSKRR